MFMCACVCVCLFTCVFVRTCVRMYVRACVNGCVRVSVGHSGCEENMSNEKCGKVITINYIPLPSFYFHILVQSLNESESPDVHQL